MKFVRMLRGPWATPYRRIKAQLATNLVGSKGNRTSSDVINDTPTISINKVGIPIEEGYNLTAQYYLQPDQTTAAHRYTDTSVSPCNAYGADHCNYLTPTLHIGMDTNFTFMNGSFMNSAGVLGGAYEISEETSLAAEMTKQFAAFGGWLLSNLVTVGLSIPGLVVGGAFTAAAGLAFVISHIIFSVGLGTLMDFFLGQHCGNSFGDRLLSSITTGIKSLLPDQPDTELEGEIMERAQNSAGGMIENSTAQTLDELHRNAERGVPPSLVII